MNQETPKSIIVVDDTPENLRLLAQMLTEEGYRVRLSPTGTLALASIQKEPPDLILLDVVMPDMDGYEVCRRLKSDDQFSDIPIIFISALNEVFDKVTAFSVGAVDYISKPFQIEEVLARVKTHLSLEDLRVRLDAQNQQLHTQNQELEAFAHTVAHDLKNPLSTLVGALDFIRDDSDAALLSEQTRGLLDLSIRNVNKINNIIDELLLLASIRKEDIQVASIDMGKVAHYAVQRLSDMIEQYQPQLSFPDTWPAAIGYAPWIEEVWVNYLSNAMKYGGTPPLVELEADSQPDGMARFSVRDNGQGLSPEARAKLFTEFTRLDTVRAEGHGLGLSIVRRIMTKLGGQFGVEHVPGGGSRFYFCLPAAD